jgi:hypothetical protein
MDKKKTERMEMLVRQGLLPARQLPLLKRALSKVEMGSTLTPDERVLFGRFTNEMMSLVFGDATTYARAKLNTQKTKYRTEESNVDDLEERMVDGIEVLDGEEERAKKEKNAKKLGRMSKADRLQLLSKTVRKEKERAGVSEEILGMHEDYKEKFQAGLKKFGVSSIRDLNPEQKKKFFNYMDTQHKAKNEELVHEAKYEYDGSKVNIAPSEYDKVHKDFKGDHKGKKMMSVYDKKTGGTVSAPVNFTKESWEITEELSDAAHELVLHADNDHHLYKSSHVPVAKNLEKKHKKGTYDHEKAKKLWKYHADRAAHSYAKQHGSPGQKGHHIFSVKDRQQAAKHFADSHHAEMKAGNFHEEVQVDEVAMAGINAPSQGGTRKELLDKLRKNPKDTKLANSAWKAGATNKEIKGAIANEEKVGNMAAQKAMDIQSYHKKKDDKKPPFDGPYRKASEPKKDKFGNVVTNRAKHLAKKGMAQAMKEGEDFDFEIPDYIPEYSIEKYIDSMIEAPIPPSTAYALVDRESKEILKKGSKRDMVKHLRAHKKKTGTIGHAVYLTPGKKVGDTVK